MKIKSYVLLAAILGAGLMGCTDASSAKKALSDQGYKNVQTTGYEWFSCGQDDWYATGFKAESVTGAQVDGVVCSGLFKGSTIRTF